VLYEEVMLIRTNLQIDDKLIQTAVKLGKHKTKKDAVTKALVEYIDHLKQEKILSMFGTVDYDPQYDHKQPRRRQ
jgi:Arc/MetJ family transcription regulator